MPWSPADASAKTKKATSPAAKKQWADVANNVLEKTGDEGRAVKTANGVVKKRGKSASKKALALRGALRGTY